MANLLWHPGVGARIARAGAIALGVLLGGTMLLDISAPDGAFAQAKKDAKKDAKADAKKGPPEGAWVKICDKSPLKGKDKDGKEISKDLEACVTMTEQIHPDNGMTLVGANLSQFKVDGKERNIVQITVPLGALLPASPAFTVFPKNLWEKVQKEKLDKAEVELLKKSITKLVYVTCHQAGCLAEAEATPELIERMKGGAGLMVETVRMPGQPIVQGVPLSGFAKALSDPPTDTKKFIEARTALMKHIAERHKQLIAELKKQQESLNKMQPNVRPDAKADDKKKTK